MTIINKLNNLTLTHPLGTTTGLVLAIVAIQQIASMLITTVYTDVTKEMFGMYIRYTASALIVLLLCKWHILRESGVTQPINKWHAKWPITILPMLLVGGINALSVEWANADFSAGKAVGWFFDNLATGLFEEVMMRGMAFYLLYRAWKDKSNGIFKAAIAQALIFGLLHLINLRDGFSIDVLAQVTYASILGFAFAGIVAFTHSIWPAVIAHAFINAMSHINPTFVANYASEPPSAQMYIVFISIIILVTAVPGYFMLRSATRSGLNEKLI